MFLNTLGALRCLFRHIFILWRVGFWLHIHETLLNTYLQMFFKLRINLSKNVLLILCTKIMAEKWKNVEESLVLKKFCK